jgi:hypothetical protein
MPTITIRESPPDISHINVTGFGQQLDRKKTTSMSGGSHWNSDTGADMVRFYLPEIYPNVSRLLYLDNDITIGISRLVSVYL